MNKEDLNKRLTELTGMETQLNADLLRVNGAKQDCIFWLAKITETTSAQKTDEPVMPETTEQQPANGESNAAHS